MSTAIRENDSTSVQPEKPPFSWERLPKALRQRGQFVLYRTEKENKVPYHPANPVQRAASTKPETWGTFEQARDAFAQYPTFDGINAVCSPDFTFVDIDDCIDADGTMSELAKRIMQSLPKSYWEVSPSGTGLHGVFRSKGTIENIGKREGSGIEVYSGKHFMSCTGWALNGTTSIAHLEEGHLKPFRTTKQRVSRSDSATAEPIGRGQRTNTLLSIAGTMRRRGLAMHSIERTLREMNAERCSPPLEEKKIQSILASIEKYKAAGDLLVQEKKDVGNADRLLLWGNGNFRYVATFDRWVVYDGARWPVEDREQELIRTEAHAMVRAFAIQAAEAGDKDAIKFAADCLNSPRITKMLREAQPNAAIRIRELDCDPLLINFQNGTLDGHTLKLREHRREDLITAMIPFDYDAKAKCPRWESFITKTFASEPEVIGFVQRALGYSLTGATSEKCLFLAHGPKDTGKTTLLATIKKLLGDYAGRIKVESLMVERGRPMDANAQSDLADLRGKRFVMTSETGQGQRLREELVKVLSQGQGDYRAVRKYENPFEFPETWKLWIDCNHLPVVRGTDDALWERLVVIPFQHVVAKTAQNLSLGEELLATEAPGILAWLVRGLQQWQQMGLKLPAILKTQHDEWQRDSDELKMWLEECCVQVKAAKATAQQLYGSYKIWRAGAGLHEESMVIFARKMKEHGFTKKTEGANKVATWFGIGVREQP